MKKKIIYVITKSFWGGAQRYVYDLATSLPQQSFDVMVIAGGSSDGELIKKLKTANIKTSSIPFLERDITIKSDIKTFFFLLKKFYQEKPDIIHLNSSKIGILGSLAGKIAGVKKIIFTAHGWAHNEQRPFFIKKILKIIVWLSLLIEDKIICVSEAVKKDIIKLPFISKKIEVIYNGVEKISPFPANEAQGFLKEKLKMNLNAETIWIGTISELHKNKGLKYAVSAMAELKNFPFIFIIIGEGEEEKNLSSLIAQYELQDKIKLFGYLEEAQKYLSAFDIFTLTSLTEALGYAIIEAGFAKLPVVASNIGGIPEIIKNNETGILVEPKNKTNLSLALKKLISDEQLRKRLGENLQKTIEANFSIEKMIKETVKLYQ